MKINVALVHQLVAAQFPQWADLPIKPIAVLDGKIDTNAATAVWETALQATWNGSPVWFHGDVTAGNLLVKDGQLSTVIDFGCSGVGDPACDLTIAWTLLSGESREAFCSALPVDGATWVRGSGWALWKGLITLAEYIHTNPLKAAEAQHVINEVLADHKRYVEVDRYAAITHHPTLWEVER